MEMKFFLERIENPRVVLQSSFGLNCQQFTHVFQFPQQGVCFQPVLFESCTEHPLIIVFSDRECSSAGVTLPFNCWPRSIYLIPLSSDLIEVIGLTTRNTDSPAFDLLQQNILFELDVQGCVQTKMSNKLKQLLLTTGESVQEYSCLGFWNFCLLPDKFDNQIVSYQTPSQDYSSKLVYEFAFYTFGIASPNDLPDFSSSRKMQHLKVLLDESREGPLAHSRSPKQEHELLSMTCL